MIPVTKHNYYRPKNTMENFTIEIDPITRPPLEYGKELIQNAIEINDLKDGKLYALYSGGIDSEMLLEVFLSQKIDITPVIIKLSPNYNDYDLKYAYQFCKNKNITPLMLDINIDEFIQTGEIIKLSEKIGPCPYQMMPIINETLKIDGTVLSGNNEPYFGPDESTGKWYLIDKEYLCLWNRLYESKQLIGTPSFLSWSAETMLAFCLDPTINKLATNQLIGKKGTYSSRNEVYSRTFPLEPRPKYTGWERLESLPIFSHENIKYIIEYKNKGNGIFKKEYTELITHLQNKIK